MPYIGISSNAQKILMNQFRSNAPLKKSSINNLANNVLYIRIIRNILDFRRNYNIEPLKTLRAQ